MDGERGRSVELGSSDTRRINAVSPMHLGESRMLSSLWKEAQQSNSELHSLQANYDDEKKQQIMLEKYQNEVRRQQMAASNNNNEWEKRQDGRDDLHPPMSHSQPSLLNIDRNEHMPTEAEKRRLAYSRGHSSEQQGKALGPPPQFQAAKPPPTNQKLVQSLREENLHLRHQVEVLKKKTLRLQQLENAHERIEKEYEGLLKEKERQDVLEKSAFASLEMRIKRLQSEKEALIDRVEMLQSNSASAMTPSHLEFNKLNILVPDLLQQNQELRACSERQRMEIEAQNATLEEQRRTIAMLEKAVNNSQDRLARKEKQCEELQASAERGSYLHRLLQDTLSDKQARDEAHAADRAQMEMELAQLKMHINKDNSMVGIKKGNTSGRSETGEDTIARLKKGMHTKDERITQLEKTVMDLQKQMHEEAERKKNAIGQLSESLEAKIKRLEEEKSDRDRKIAQLTEEKEKLAEMLDMDSEDEEEMKERRDMNRMEEIRRRIQERKGRHRPIRGLCGGFHTRTTSAGRTTLSHSSPSTTPNHSDYIMDPTILHYGLPYLPSDLLPQGKAEDNKQEAQWNV